MMKKGNLIYVIKNGAGKVKEFDDNFKLKFEGEYLNGIRNGKGKEYENGKVVYEGIYSRGLSNSKCLII